MQVPTTRPLRPVGGAILEPVMLTEVLQALLHRGGEPDIHVWKATVGAEPVRYRDDLPGISKAEA